MAPDQAFPLLAALIFFPGIGAVLLGLFRGKDAWAPWIGAGLAGVSLALAIWTQTLEGVPTERFSWIPSLGVIAIFEGDRSCVGMAAWVALASILIFVVTRPGAKTVALVLALQAVSTALFFAGDVTVALACLGMSSIAVALSTSVPRNVLVFATAGLVVLTGWFARYFHMAYEQTGFPSTELARWRSLVLYPDEERAVFIVGAIGLALLLPAFAIALENGSRSERLALYSSAGMMGQFFVVRCLVPLAPGGASMGAGWVVAFAVVLMAWAGLARGWTLLAVGYQGLVLFALFGVSGGGVMRPEGLTVAASVGFFAASLTSRRVLEALSASALIAVAIAGVWIPAWREPSASALVATLAFALMAVGFVRVVRRGQR